MILSSFKQYKHDAFIYTGLARLWPEENTHAVSQDFDQINNGEYNYGNPIKFFQEPDTGILYELRGRVDRQRMANPFTVVQFHP